LRSSFEPHAPPSHTPTISICIPTYNRAWSLGQAIDSALSQTGDVPCEVLVVDDGSTDGTPALVHSYADARVRYERNETNAGYAGMSRNWNRCLEYARGEYITILGDDDYLAPDFVAAHTAVLDAHPAVGLVYCACHLPNLAGDLTGEWWPFPHSHVWASEQELEYMTRRLYILSGPVMRRALLAQVGPFNTQMLFYFEWELFLRLTCRGGVGYITRPLYYKRVHDRKLSLQFDTGSNGQRVKDEANGMVERVLGDAPHLTPERRRALNRRRYGEIAKGEWIEALHALRRREIRRSASALRSGWYWQFAKAGWWNVAQALGDAMLLWRKRRQGRMHFVFDVS
jgi:glycosyltransferase involved in cell wall biosynthesis